MTVTLISAVSPVNGIGMKGKLLYRVPEDLKRFKEMTLGSVVIMGRKTFEEIGMPLPHRDNIVITSNPHFGKGISNLYVVDSLEKAIEIGKKFSKEIFIIGGEQVYRAGMKYASKIELTRITPIGKSVPDADRFFPQINTREFYLDAADGIVLDDHVLEFLTYRKW